MSTLPFPVGSPPLDRPPRSNTAPRRAAPDGAVAQRSAARTADAVDQRRDEQRDRTNRADRNTPPDFAALLALLERSTLAPPVAPTAGEEPGLTRAVNLASGEARTDTPASREALLQEAQLRESRLRDLMADTQQESLRTMRAMLTERGALLTPAAESALPMTAGARTEATPGVVELLAMANRAQRAGRGELLARNDTDAAGVRAALDALLDLAGTSEGRAVAEEFGSSAAITGPSTALDPTAVERDPALLAREFRTRLDRVIARMRDEFGHDVQVVETARSPERQDALYAQGRSTAGPIVTWTTNSAHLTGEAADVLIDGKWNYPQAYARLHEIAAQEGLNTLGMRDAGHLELRGSATTVELAGLAPVNLPDYSPNLTPGAPDVAPGVARVAAVAQVATVAQVAQVAQVARPGGGAVGSAGNGSEGGSGREAPAGGTMLNSAASLIAGGDSSASARGGGTDSSSRDQSRGELRREVERAAARSPGGSGGDVGASVTAATAAVERLGDRGAPRVELPVGSTAAARAETIAALREDGPAQPISALTMQLDGADGRSDAVRVSLRGGAVGAQVSTNDPALADRLRMQTASLQDALGQHGLDSAPLRVERNSRLADGDALRSAVGERGDLAKAAGTGASAGQQQGNGTDSGARERPTARQQEERDAQDARETRDDRGEPHHQRRRDRRQEQE